MFCCSSFPLNTAEYGMNGESDGDSKIPRINFTSLIVCPGNKEVTSASLNWQQVHNKSFVS